MHCLSHCSMSNTQMNLYWEWKKTTKKKQSGVSRNVCVVFLFFVVVVVVFFSSFLMFVAWESISLLLVLASCVHQSVRQCMTFVPFSEIYSALNSTVHVLKLYQCDNKIEKGKASSVTPSKTDRVNARKRGNNQYGVGQIRTIRIAYEWKKSQVQDQRLMANNMIMYGHTSIIPKWKIANATRVLHCFCFHFCFWFSLELANRQTLKAKRIHWWTSSHGVIVDTILIEVPSVTIKSVDPM